MNIQNKTAVLTIMMAALIPSGQVLADAHKKMVHDIFTDSVEYEKYRDSNSPYTARAIELIGEDVENAQDDEIGEIDDVVYSEADNKLYAVISVGGFLGIGEKLVAVPYNELRMGADGDDIYLDTTEELLKSRPEFKYNEGD